MRLCGPVRNCGPVPFVRAGIASRRRYAARRVASEACVDLGIRNSPAAEFARRRERSHSSSARLDHPTAEIPSASLSIPILASLPVGP